MHGLALPSAGHDVATFDVDFFIGPNFLVTVHDGRSAALDELRASRRAHAEASSATAPSPCSTASPTPSSTAGGRAWIGSPQRIDVLENGVFDKPSPAVVRDVLAARRDVAALRRVIGAQRDVVARLARRDFVDISTEMSFRFRDLHDHLVRLADDAALAEDRLADLLSVGAAAAFGRKAWI